MPDTASSPRRDWAVIMARGASSRMGYPKGTAAPGPQQPPMLTLVDSLYRQQEWPRAIVTLPDQLALYQTLLEADSRRVWLTDGPGGDTARTLKAAWIALAARPEPPTHFWAHPVDLPLVNSESLVIIREQSVCHPRKIIRPNYRGQPGHPVVFPAELMAGFFSGGPGFEHDGPMRQLLAEALAQVVDCSVTDPGVVQDFDDPQALQQP